MTDAELNHLVHVHIFDWDLDKLRDLGIDPHRLAGGYPWNYCGDMRLAWDVEERILALGLQKPYVLALHDVLDFGDPETRVFSHAIEFGDRFWGKGDQYLWAFVHATPRQRVMAALRAVGAPLPDAPEVPAEP